MSDSSVINKINNKLSKIENETDVKSTPTSPMTSRWKFRTNGIETIKNSSSEPNVSVNNETVKTVTEEDNAKRNSKSEDCLLDLDKTSENILSSASKAQSCEDNTFNRCKRNPADDIFARALKERLGLKTDVATPGRVMVQNEGSGGDGSGAGEGGGLIAPRRLVNPCLESSPRQDLHRELLFNQKIGKNVLNQKSELERALSKHKEKQVINQEKDHKKTPELERAIAERARRLEESTNNKIELDKTEAACNPQYIEARARLRHAK